MKILMVCLGNICRSPIAEGVLKHKAAAAGLNWTVDSAGTNGLHDGQPPHHLSQLVSRQNGIEICDQQSRKFVPRDFDRYDKIYAMAQDVISDMRRIAGKKFDRSKADLLMNELYPGENREVPDPWSGPEEEYHHAFRLIDAACEAIVRKYGANVPQSQNQATE
ncbi:MAG TPA: low molecular weight protein-tyrosine-phosphatase [Chitinophagaceae bacterium]